MKTLVDYINESYVTEGKLKFENEDLVICDPCYFVDGDDWDKSKYGEEMTNLGFKEGDFAVVETTNGDGEYTVTINKEPAVKLKFKYGVDAGVVGIFKLSDIKNYKKDFDVVTNARKNLCVRIEKFSGVVTIKQNKTSNSIVGKGNNYKFSTRF